MEKTITIRPNAVICDLMEKITRLRPLTCTSLKATFREAVAYTTSVIADTDLAELIRESTEIQPENTITPPEFMKLNLEESEHDQIVAALKDTGLIRVHYNVLVRVCLLCYLKHLEKTSAFPQNADKCAMFGMDSFVFKYEYDAADAESFPEKERLYALCKEYLSNRPELLQKIREDASESIRRMSDVYNAGRYFPERSKRLGTVYMPFIGKAFAGLLICLAQIDGITPEEVIRIMENAVNDQ